MNIIADRMKRTASAEKVLEVAKKEYPDYDWELNGMTLSFKQNYLADKNEVLDQDLGLQVTHSFQPTDVKVFNDFDGDTIKDMEVRCTTSAQVMSEDKAVRNAVIEKETNRTVDTEINMIKNSRAEFGANWLNKTYEYLVEEYGETAKTITFHNA
jgi:hypothetical protein